MALLSVIRRWHFREKLSIREIARRTKLSRNALSKYLRSGEIEPRYPKRHRASQLDAYAADLSAWLRSNQSAPRKQRRTVRQMHAALLARGYTGSYGRVAAFARSWRQAEQERARTAGRGVFVPLTFAPGEAFQFDWSEDWAHLGGSRVKLQIAQFKLSHSRAFLLRAYPLQSHEMLFDAHNHAFAVFGGVPRRGIYECKGLPALGSMCCRARYHDATLETSYPSTGLKKEQPMAIITVGIDLAKNVFAVHGIGTAGRPELVRPEVRRHKLLELVASLPPCLIGMEACSGAHHWARQFEKHGHTVRLMAPKFVTPYRMSGKRGKNDANDAAAIAEAVTRPNMRFVPIKTMDQQAELFVHRARQGYVEERTALINRLRGLLSELGFLLPMKTGALRQEVYRLLETLPGWCNTVVNDMISHLSHLDERVAEYDKHLVRIAERNDKARQLMAIKGIGPITSSAMVASIGNGHDFKNSRQFCAWLGLTPGQHSSGGKSRLGSITRAGDKYLRTLLVMGARSLLMRAANHTDPVSRWALKLKERRGFGRAVVAIAAKNARMCWAALQLGDAFKVPA